jgi:SAM-dependent methyltransferase
VPDPGPQLSPREYYEKQVGDADGQFDHRETTLSHLLRVPHPALAGRTYGQALIDALIDRELLPGSGPLRVLEVGAGLGYVARDSLIRMGERGLAPEYHIVELSPALAAAQRARLAEAGVAAELREGDILELELPAGGYDFILGNEMIGDLPAVQLERHQVGFQMPADSPERLARLDKLGETGELIRESGLSFDDAPDPFYLTTGAIELVRKAWHALAPGGVCVLTEFGELHTYPRLSTQLDHPELSIHFAHLSKAAEAVGFEVKFEFIIDLLDFDRTLEGMATTRSYFRALSLVLGEHGIELAKIGYTREMWDELLGDKLGDTRLGDIYFDKLEDRLMGLVPHEFKALILRKPAEA